MSFRLFQCCGLLGPSDETGFPATSVHYLSTTFLKEVEEHGLDRNANLYEIENLSSNEYGVIRKKGADIVCPVDGELGASYVHCLNGEDNVGEANYMLSYTWGYTIGDIVDSLVEYCASTNQSPKRVYVWMCCLCVNQHRVVKLRDEGKVVPFEDFSNTFYQRVNGIQNILSMMMSWNEPAYLKRAWCIYEMYVATTSSECNVTILMPPKEKHRFAKEIEDGEGGNIFFKVMSQTNIEKASAFPADKELIMKAVHEGPGAHKLNVAINDLLIDWSKTAILDVISTREKECTDSSTDVQFARFLRKVGLLFWKQGFYEHALEQQLRALETQTRVLGGLNTETAQTHNDIGMTYSNLHRQKEAVFHCQKALDIRREILGEVNKDTAASYSTVAMRLKSLGELDAALEMVMKALDVRRKLYNNKDHADICRSLITVGRVLAAKEQHREALEYLEKAVDVARSDDVQDVRLEARALDDMGSSYSNLGKVQDALNTYEKCLVIREKILGSNHKLTVKIRNNIESLTGSR